MAAGLHDMLATMLAALPWDENAHAVAYRHMPEVRALQKLISPPSDSSAGDRYRNREQSTEAWWQPYTHAHTAMSPQATHRSVHSCPLMVAVLMQLMGA